MVPLCISELFSQVLLGLLSLGFSVRVPVGQQVLKERGHVGGEVGVLVRKLCGTQGYALIVDLSADHLEHGAVLGAPLVLVQANVEAGGQRVEAAVVAYFVVLDGIWRVSRGLKKNLVGDTALCFLFGGKRKES